MLCLCFALVVIANGAVLDKRVSKRSQRQEVPFAERLEAEQRLSDLGYWIGPVDGTLDPAFRHALIAFQKVEGRQRTGSLTNDELLALRTATRPIPQAQVVRNPLLLAGITLEMDRDRGPTVEIMHQAPAAATHGHMTHTIAGVQRLAIDRANGPEEGLELEDKEGAVTIMRFESEGRRVIQGARS